MNIQDAANVVQGQVDYGDNPPAQLDPVLMGLIIQILTTLITDYGPTILNYVTNFVQLNICNKIALRMTIRRKIQGQQRRQYGDLIYNAVLKSYPMFTPEDVRSVMNSMK